MTIFVEKISKLLGISTSIVAVLMMSIAIASLNIQVFTRYVMGHSASWSEELAMFLFTWSILLVGSLGVREKFHVSLTFILDLSSQKIRIIAEKVLHLATFTFGFLFATSGVSYLERTLGQVSAAVQYPMEWLYLSAPVSGVLICVHSFAHLVGRPSMENNESEPKESGGSVI